MSLSTSEKNSLLNERGIASQMAKPFAAVNKELRQVLLEKNRKKISAEGVCGYRSPDGEVDKRSYYRMRAIEEVIISERNYLGQLELLMKFFVRPIKHQALIDDHTHTFLFGQIEMIYNLNMELLQELEENKEDVAKAFLKIAPFLKLYSVYAFDFRNALLVLQEITSKNSSFRKFKEQTETRPEVQRTLNSLMIVPIQRLPRYKLLLDQVLLYTSPSENDFKLLKDSVKKIESIVSHINSCVEEQEVTLKLLNLQNSIINRSPNIVKPSRRIIKEGTMNKISRSGTQIKRYCVLMSDIFLYCKILKERQINTVVENALECCCIFPLKKCKVYELFPDSFKITCQGDGIILKSPDVQLVQEWIVNIRYAIDTHIQCRRTLRKESSKRKPTRKKNVKYFDCENTNSRKSGYESIIYNKNCNTSSEDEDENKGCFRFNKIGCTSATAAENSHEVRKSALKRKTESAVKNMNQTKTALSEYTFQKENDGILLPPLEKRVKFDLKECNTNRRHEKFATENVCSKESLADRVYKFFANLF
ncbi:unnamed protein product [Ceratitis capitata]|uniref:(Mediterranean fruit fly) hypothetical protein n=1 Tax=Ceratitis capitata TaxID=7213 RepID=W8CAP3_CERCA|nr:unnamed protein product [Ceratitis capitata]